MGGKVGDKIEDDQVIGEVKDESSNLIDKHRIEIIDQTIIDAIPKETDFKF